MGAEKAWHMQQGCFWKEAAFIGKVMETRKKEVLPSVSTFWSEAGKNSQTLLDRTAKAMESICSPLRKKASNAWEIAAKLNVKILSTELPGCSALTDVIHIFILSSSLLFPLHQSTELPEADPCCWLHCAFPVACPTVFQCGYTILYSH